jgi:hypothetical protein
MEALYRSGMLYWGPDAAIAVATSHITNSGVIKDWGFGRFGYFVGEMSCCMSVTATNKWDECTAHTVGSTAP